MFNDDISFDPPLSSSMVFAQRSPCQTSVSSFLLLLCSYSNSPIPFSLSISLFRAVTPIWGGGGADFFFEKGFKNVLIGTKAYLLCTYDCITVIKILSVQSVLEMEKNKFRFELKRTETQSVSVVFRIVS
jgi:hypothetical protein